MPHSEMDADKLPQWIHNISLKNAVQENLGCDFERITGVLLDNITKDEDVGSLTLRVTAQVQINGEVNKSVSFILKTQKLFDSVPKIYQQLALLSKEEKVYQKILPKFEQLYKDAGKTVKISPRAFTFDSDYGHDYVLIEDLSGRNYQHGNRTLGLDLNHMEQALIKLAEFHAASAFFVEHFGMFDEQFTQSIYKESNKSWLKDFYSSKQFLTQLKQMKLDQSLYEKLLNADDQLVNRLLELQNVNPKEFNVLNHGDLWVNNIIFQHDAFGNIKDTLLIDFQVNKYGSPANDLYYFIISSADSKIKLSKFDYLVHYYYDHLIENLKVLQYPRPLPKLKSIHASLLNHGLIAYLVISKVLPVVTFEEKSNDKFVVAKTNAYNNPKYVQAVEELLPWLNHRGGLDWI